MLFPTIDFAIFFAVVYTVSWLLNPFPGPWKIFMVAASYFFYAWADWRFVFLLAASTVIAFVGGAALHRLEGHARRVVLWVTLSGLLGLLAWFKYYVFVTVNVDNLFHGIGIGRPLPLLNVTLPIAISFFTFMAVSYVVDVHRGVLKPARPMDLAVYLSFFPHLVAGPIVRGTELLPQIRRRRDPAHVDYVEAFWLIAAGLAKKVVLSSFLATYVVDPVFAAPRLHSGPEVVVAVWGYAVQIYADFSGYTDMAIGIALLLGFRFPQNFNRPYTAVSLQDFWRRWHMTLSAWLRDYLYVPLGGNRGPEWRISVNILITMVLGGLWHGAAWTFIGWGLYHGIGQVIGRQRRRWRAAHDLPLAPSGRARVALAQFVTFQVVCVGWLFFRATSFSNAWSLFGRVLSGWGPSPLVTPLALLAIAAGIGSQYLPDDWLDRVKAVFAARRPVVQGGILGLVLLVITTLGPQGVAPFIYYRF
ncbi:MAG: MBOAT family O-acyltransferase [Acidimicrobiales bacterium]|jgi:D-alanyl-lipoteichoic acid acyltransferase DltB (MBOAT superfamily)